MSHTINGSDQPVPQRLKENAAMTLDLSYDPVSRRFILALEGHAVGLFGYRAAELELVRLGVPHALATEALSALRSSVVTRVTLTLA